MKMERVLQLRISEKLYDKILLEALLSGLSVAAVCRLKLWDKRIISKEEHDKLKSQGLRFRPIKQ